MEIVAIILVLTALGGGVMAAIRVTGRPYPPLWLAVGHGALAIAGVALLGYLVATQTVPLAAKWALGMLLATATGGLFLLFGFHLRNQPLPIVFMLGHGLLAIASVVVLLLAVFGR